MEEKFLNLLDNSPWGPVLAFVLFVASALLLLASIGTVSLGNPNGVGALGGQVSFAYIGGAVALCSGAILTMYAWEFVTWAYWHISGQAKGDRAERVEFYRENLDVAKMVVGSEDESPWRREAEIALTERT